MAEAARDNSAKPPMENLGHFGPALEALAWHAQKGREKYPDDSPGVPNWTLGGKPDEEYTGAAMRHLLALQRNEWWDDEGFSHAAAVMWNIAALLTCNHPNHNLMIKGRGTQMFVNVTADEIRERIAQQFSHVDDAGLLD